MINWFLNLFRRQPRLPPFPIHSQARVMLAYDVERAHFDRNLAAMIVASLEAQGYEVVLTPEQSVEQVVAVWIEIR